MSTDTREGLVGLALERAAVRLGRPGAWCKGATARDFAGRVVEGSDKSAVCWCICAAVDVEATALAVPYETALSPLGGDQLAIRFNDSSDTTQEGVVALLTNAAATVRLRALASQERTAQPQETRG